MKPRVALVVLLIGLGGLVVVLLQAGTHDPSVRPTGLPTATVAPTVEAPTHTPAPSPTLVRPTATRTEPPSDTATPTTEPAATQPAIEGSVGDYELQVPPADALLGLYVEAQRQDSGFCFGVGGSEWAQMDLGAVQTAALFNIHHFYAEGLPVPHRILEIPWNQECGYARSAPDLGLLTEAAWDAVKGQHFSESGSFSDADLKAEVYKVELDGDPQPEWFLQVVFEHYPVVTWLTLDEGADGQLRRLATLDLPPSYFFLGNIPEVAGVEDLTGDGRTDLVITYENYGAGQTYGHADILQGTAQGFKRIASKKFGYFLEDDSFLHELAHTETGQPYLHLVHTNDLNWGCSWKTDEADSWPNGVERVKIVGEKPPNTPQCAVAQAVSTLQKPPDNQTAIRLLESAVRAFAITPADQPDYELFVHYRLAVLYALEGQQAAARKHLVWLQNYAATTLARAPEDYVNFVKSSVETELDSKQVNPVRLCDAMASHAYLLVERLDYLRETAATNAYPLSAEPYPRAFCPVDDVLEDIVSKIKLNPTESPVAALAKAGVTVAYAQPDTSMSDSNDWVLVLQLDRPELVLAQDGKINVIAYTFQKPTGSLLALHEDFTGDGLEDTLVAYPSTSGNCQTEQSAYEIAAVLSIRLLGNRSREIVWDVVCLDSGQKFEWATFLADKDGDGESDWIKAKLALFGVGSDAATPDPAWQALTQLLALGPNEDALDGISKLDAAFYQDPSSTQTRDLLARALAAVPANNPNGPRVQQHLQYLIAQADEVKGNTQAAIEEYFAVWASPTQTLWGNLAALHLAHK